MQLKSPRMMSPSGSQQAQQQEGASIARARSPDDEAPAQAQSAPSEPPSRMAPLSARTEDSFVGAENFSSANHNACHERCGLLSESTEGWLKKESIAEACEAMQKIEGLLENTESILVEQNSVYGTALVMPQFARSTGWSAKVTILAFRSYLFLVLNIFIQWMLLYSLMKEQNVMNKFSGEMFLCNFGAEKLGCPEGPGCLGPGGTRFTPSRTVSYEAWKSNNFVKTSLKAVFPEHTEDIDSNVDPGEYGIESQSTRLVCTWLFILLLVEDAQQIITLLKLLWYVPACQDNWITLVDGEVNLEIKGMPFYWKIINLICIVSPKAMLWKFTADSGTLFLMETASIQDLIVNSTALTFILNIDELLFATITTAKTRYMLGCLQPFVVHRHPAHKTTWATCVRETLSDKLPGRLLLVTVIWMSSLVDYYYRHCNRHEDGTWYSMPMYLPLSVQYSHLSAFLPRLFPIPSEPDAYWSLPDEI